MPKPVIARNIAGRLRAASIVAFVAVAGVAVLPVMADFTAPAKAADVPEVVKKRQATMKRMGSIVTSVKNYGEGKTDQATALKDAQELPGLARTIPDLFPKGTGNPDLPGVSGAKAEIWDDWATFETAAKSVEQLSGKLIAVVQAGDPAKVGPELGDFGKNGCNACHNKFRMRI